MTYPHHAAIPLGVAPQPMGAYPYPPTHAVDMYGQPLLASYPHPVHAVDPVYSGYRGVTPPLPYYPRRRKSRWARMMEALVMGSEAERLREVAVRHDMLLGGLPDHRAMLGDPYYGHGGYGYGGYPPVRGLGVPVYDPYAMY